MAEADVVLGHVLAWTSKDAGDKARRLETAALWLDAMYALPATPTADELETIKRAEYVAARVGLTVSLFPVPTDTGTVGALILKREDVAGIVETEERWSAPTSATIRTGPIEIFEVDAILSGIAERSTGGAASGVTGRLIYAL